MWCGAAERVRVRGPGSSCRGPFHGGWSLPSGHTPREAPMRPGYMACGTARAPDHAHLTGEPGHQLSRRCCLEPPPTGGRTVCGHVAEDVFHGCVKDASAADPWV